MKEVISKEDSQAFFIKFSMEYSHHTTFMHNFEIEMEKFKECNLVLDINKALTFNSREETILTQHEAWRKYFQKKGG